MQTEFYGELRIFMRGGRKTLEIEGRTSERRVGKISEDINTVALFSFFLNPGRTKEVHSFTIFSLEKENVIAMLWDIFPFLESKHICLHSLKLSILMRYA